MAKNERENRSVSKGRVIVKDGTIIQKQRIPSPHADIDLFIVTYRSDGLQVKGYLVEPQTNEVLPGLLYLRGGIKRVGMVRKARMIQYASLGFIVFAPFYRGNLGGEGQEDFAGYDRNDAINGGHLLLEHERTNGLHIIGFSRGGVMALFTAMALRDTVSVVCWNGVTDMRLTYEERVDLRKMMKRVIGTPTKYPERYDWRTPLLTIEKIKAPVCIIHGVLDEHVSVEHAYRLESILLEKGKQAETWYFPSFTHYFPEPHNRKIIRDIAVWMKQHPNESRRH